MNATRLFPFSHLKLITNKKKKKMKNLKVRVFLNHTLQPFRIYQEKYNAISSSTLKNSLLGGKKTKIRGGSLPLIKLVT